MKSEFEKVDELADRKGYFLRYNSAIGFILRKGIRDFGPFKSLDEVRQFLRK